MFLDPTLDVVFKLMLTSQPESQEVLIALIEAVLQPTSRIAHATVRDPEIPRENIRDKNIRLDVVVTLSDGRVLDLEMQTRKTTGFRDRALYYWARLFVDGLEVGGEYKLLRPAISILFLDYIELKTPECHTTFKLLDTNPARRTPEPWSDRIELHVIELPKARRAVNMEPKLHAWLRFFKAKTTRQRKALSMTDPTLTKAQNILDRLADDPKTRRLAEERRAEEYFWQVDRKLTVEKAQAEGEARGEVRGEARGEVRGEARGAIRAYCEVFAIELTETREAALAEMDLASLRGLLQQLKQQRSWPD